MNCLYKVLKNARVTYEEKPCYLGGEKPHDDISVPHKAMDDFHERERALEQRIKNAESEIEAEKRRFQAEMRLETARIVENAKSECSAEMLRQAHKGFDEGMKVAKSRCDALDGEIEKLKSEIGGEFEKQIEELKGNITTLALMLARKIISIELEKDDTAVLSALNDVLIRFKDEKNLTIELSEELAEKIDISKIKPIYEISVNRELTNEEILLNSDYGTIDASIDAQFENLKKALLEECREI